MKKIISLFIVFTIIFSYCFTQQSVNASFLDTVDPPRYWKDPQQISDEHFFGVYDKESGTWKDPGLLCYSNPLLDKVKTYAMEGKYGDAKEELRNAVSEKFASFPKKAFNTDEKSTYLRSLLFKYNILSVNNPLDILEVSDEWGWVEVDISSQISSFTKEKAFYFVAIEKDDSVIEISSRRGEAQYAPRIEAVVNSQVVSSTAVMDAMTSGGSNIYVSSDNLTKDNPGILKVAESSTTIGGGSNPIDENTFRTYLRFNLEDIIKPGDLVSKATLKIYTRINGSKEKKQMLLYSLGATIWTGDLSWADTQVENTVFVFDGDDAINWDVKVANIPSTVRESPTNFDGMFDVISYAELHDEPEALYYLLCRLMSYMYDVGMPPQNALSGTVAGSTSLRTASRVIALSENMRYYINSEAMPTDIFIAIMKHLWLMLDFFENPNNFEKAHNFGVYQSRGLLFGAITFDDIFERGKHWVDLALDRYTIVSNGMILEDGTSADASMSYARDMVSMFVQVYEIPETVGKGKDYIQFPEEFETNLRKLAKHTLDSTYNLYDTQFGDTTDYTSKTASDSYYKYIDDEHYAWSYTGGRVGSPPDYTSILYPLGGKISMRSEWTNRALYLHTNNDRFLRSHAHDDDLSIIAFAYGQYLLVDPLFYTYSWNNDKAWLVGKTGHNVVVINKEMGQTGQNVNTAFGYDTNEIGPIERWETNDGFDFVSMIEEKVGKTKTEILEDVYHTRDIMFIRDKFWIVTDLLEPQDKEEYNRYEQRWHFLPEAKIKMDPETMVLETTAFRANMKIYPVAPYDYEPVENYNEDATGIQSGLYSPKRDQLVSADYAYYLKSDVKGDTSFVTVLFPMEDGSEYEVKTEAIPTKFKSTEATAFSIEYVEEDTNIPCKGTYFNLHKEELKTENLVSNYSTDGRLVYVETIDDKYNTVDLAQGKHVKDIDTNTELIYSTDELYGIAVKWDAKGIHIDSMNDIDLSGLTVYNNGSNVSKVYYNNSEVPFNQQGRYVYFGDSPIIDDAEDKTEQENPKPSGPSSSQGDSGGGSGSGSSSSQSYNKHGASEMWDKVDITIPENPTVETPTHEIKRFDDVSSDRWSAEYIKELNSLGVISGYEDGTFRPENSITREEFVKLVLEALQIPANDNANVFTDVPNDSWYQKYVSSAYELGIVNGIDESNFGVGKSISRQDMSVIIIRALEYKNQSLKTDEVHMSFRDADNISDYARFAVDTLANSGIVSGNEAGEFMPDGNATREQVAKIICLVLKNIN